MKILIKNMVCDRRKLVIQNVLDEVDLATNTALLRSNVSVAVLSDAIKAAGFGATESA